MAEADKIKPDEPQLPSGPLVFISHDTRDAELAEAFSKLLKSVSAGMIKTFRSSDKKAGDGIDFGEEWYKRLMTQLQATSDVVCLFTERSLDRPWILFEAGVAKGKLDTPVIGLALGVPLGRVSAGPFYQFQNMDDSEVDLTKLINQLAKRVPGVELDQDVVKAQVQNFKNVESGIIKQIAVSAGKKTEPNTSEGDENSVAKLMEEMKTLPSRIAERIGDEGEFPRRRRMRRIHPMMIEELMRMPGESGDPMAILMAASMFRDDLPWLYELAMEVYRAAKSGNADTIEREMARVGKFTKLIMRGPFMEEFGFITKEHHMLAMEFPRMLDHALRRSLDHAPRKRVVKQPTPVRRKASEE
jgi:hypothetical protein